MMWYREEIIKITKDGYESFLVVIFVKPRRGWDSSLLDE